MGREKGREFGEYCSCAVDTKEIIFSAIVIQTMPTARRTFQKKQYGTISTGRTKNCLMFVMFMFKHSDYCVLFAEIFAVCL